jgi:hypothetical protein
MVGLTDQTYLFTIYPKNMIPPSSKVEVLFPRDGW